MDWLYLHMPLAALPQIALRWTHKLIAVGREADQEKHGGWRTVQSERDERVASSGRGLHDAFRDTKRIK